MPYNNTAFVFALRAVIILAFLGWVFLFPHDYTPSASNDVPLDAIGLDGMSGFCDPRGCW